MLHNGYYIIHNINNGYYIIYNIDNGYYIIYSIHNGYYTIYIYKTETVFALRFGLQTFGLDLWAQGFGWSRIPPPHRIM